MGESSDVLAQRVAARLDCLFENVFSARLGRPWTDGEVAEATGVSVAEVAALRRGRPLSPVHRDPQHEHVAAGFTERLNHLLSQRRDEHGEPYSLRAAARAAGMSPTYLDKLLEGRSQPTLSKLAPLASFLGVGIDVLTTDSLGAIARHFGVRREALTYEPGSPVVVELEDTLKALAAYRRISQSPEAVTMAFRMADLPIGRRAEVSAAVEELFLEMTSRPGEVPPVSPV
ncbi:helix-turn-helix transcriptional regulator [Streptomyces sp. TRM66268-LWL]|uniref:Helix-turn-helix transcriptional regulator n=1 Tax=Streptomyces polyasparticus TaxID=2767826 RepID=A0ABR7STT4_9ACTN|nr:helix-turn-helix transcriptional regulator [Streptomyces polyasparticus]MBC9718894.1 helix-turn-helix transcriptional regulator [Streptomyces polyasparticus]